MNKRLVIALAICLAVVVGLVAKSMFDSSRPVDEAARIRALIDHLAASAEKHKIKELRAHISKGYTGQQGRDRAWLSRLLSFHLLRRSVLSVYILSKLVTVDEGDRSANAEVKLVLTRSPKVKDISRLVPHAAKALRLTLTWTRHEDDTWQVSSASWKQLGFSDVVPGR